MSLKLAIWDVDGTIVDSRGTISACMDQAFEQLGLQPPGYEKTRTMVGLGLFDGIAEIAAPGTPDAVIQDLCIAYKEAFVRYRSQDGFVEQLYDGAVTAIEKLANKNWLLAISTGKSKRGLNSMFASYDLQKYFDTIWCADDGPGKPHPFMCLEAMSAVGAEPHQSLMIGDAVHDMRMGKAAGLTTFGVSWGFGETNELHEAGADQVFDTFEGLNAALETFRSNKP